MIQTINYLVIFGAITLIKLSLAYSSESRELTYTIATGVDASDGTYAIVIDTPEVCSSDSKVGFMTLYYDGSLVKDKVVKKKAPHSESPEGCIISFALNTKAKIFPLFVFIDGVDITDIAPVKWESVDAKNFDKNILLKIDRISNHIAEFCPGTWNMHLGKLVMNLQKNNGKYSLSLDDCNIKKYKNITSLVCDKGKSDIYPTYLSFIDTKLASCNGSVDSVKDKEDHMYSMWGEFKADGKFVYVFFKVENVYGYMQAIMINPIDMKVLGNSITLNGEGSTIEDLKNAWTRYMEKNKLQISCTSRDLRLQNALSQK